MSVIGLSACANIHGQLWETRMNSEYIPYDEVTYQGLSFTDSDRLFKWNGELFRGIPSERASFCRCLFTKGIIRKFIAKQLFVETEITPLKIDHHESS